ncbi:MAG: hypothetical protein WC503_02370 [Candidatus Shapirobacteria bacterium]
MDGDQVSNFPSPNISISQEPFVAVLPTKLDTDSQTTKGQIDPKQPSSKKILIVVIVFVICLIGVGVGILISRQNKKSINSTYHIQEQNSKPTVIVQPTSIPTKSLVINTEEVIPNVLDGVEITIQMMGAFSSNSLYSDGSFMRINNLPTSNTENRCLEGKILVGEYNEFINYVKKSGILELKENKNEFEPGLVCDGGLALFVRIGGKENVLGSVCSRNQSEENEKIETIKTNINYKLDEFLNKNHGKLCSEGGYVEIIRSDDFCKEPTPYNQIEELPPYIVDGINYGKNYVYTGQIDEKVIKWNNKFFKLNNACYYTRLYQFVEKNFEYFYD